MLLLWISTGLSLLLTAAWRLRRASAVLDAILAEEGPRPTRPTDTPDRVTPGLTP